jgi:Domain of unknown function (DUF4112)
MDRSKAARQLVDSLPLGTDARSVRRRVEALEQLLENTFVIPVINRPIGLDALAGLVPGIGDAITAIMGLYLVWEARNIGLPKWRLWQMTGRVGLDALLGTVPLAGDLFDFLYRSNTRNLKVIRRHLDRHHPETALVEG